MSVGSRQGGTQSSHASPTGTMGFASPPPGRLVASSGRAVAGAGSHALTATTVRIVMLLATGFGLYGGFDAAAGSAGGRAVGCHSSRSGAWSRLPAPDMVESLQGVPGSECALVGVDGTSRLWRTDNGGLDWRTTPLPGASSMVFGSRLPAHTILVALTPSAGGGFALSRDGGLTFTSETASDPKDLSGTEAVDAVGSQPYGNGGAGDVYVSLRRQVAGHAAVYSLAKVTPDGAVTVNAGAGALTVGSLAWEPTGYAPLSGSPLGNLWVTDSTSAAADNGLALLLSQDGGQTFEPPASRVSEPLADVRYGKLASGAPILAVASSHGGVLWSTDDGSSWKRTQMDNGLPVRAVELGAQLSDVAVALTATGTWQTSDNFTSFHAADAGLPPTCTLTDLSAFPGAGRTRFIGSCDSGHQWFWYQPPSGNPHAKGSPGGGVGGTNVQPMLPLATVPLGDPSSSGSLAFDGSILYYASLSPPYTTTRVIFRVRARDGVQLPSLPVPVYARFLTYNANRDAIDFIDENGLNMYELSLTSGRTVRLFSLQAASFSSAYSYDPTRDGFAAAVESTTTVLHTDAHGAVTSQCQTRTGSIGDNSQAAGFYAAAGMVADGHNGGGYVEAEDDATIREIDGQCRILATFAHRPYAEAVGENDSLVCDSVTFYPRIAVWIRDSSAASVSAYQVPGGRCEMPTRLTLSVPAIVHSGTTTTVCAGLYLQPHATPIVGERIAGTVDGRSLAMPRTGTDGRSCTRYTPRKTHIRHHIETAHASFTGTDRYAPSTTSAVATILGVAPVAPSRTVTGRTVPVLPVAPVAPAAAAPAGSSPDPPPGPGAQAQAQPQQQPQTKPNPLSAVATAPEEQIQLATARVDNNTSDMSAFGIAAGALMCAAGAYAVRFKRRTQAQFDHVRH